MAPSHPRGFRLAWADGRRERCSRPRGPLGKGRTLALFVALAIPVVLLAVFGLPARARAQGGSQADLTVDQLHIFLAPFDTSVQVSEYYLLGNSGDVTYTGAAEGGQPGVTVAFPLPTGAENVALDPEDDPDRYLFIDNTIADTQPISPGVATVEARFAYELPIGPDPTFLHTVPLPVKSVVLVVVGDGWALDGPVLSPMGSMDIQGQQAQAYTMGPLAAGDEIAFSIVAGASPASGVADSTGAAGTTGASGTSGTPSSGSWGIVLGAVAVVGAGIAAAGFLRPGPAQAATSPASSPQVQTLVAEIAALDAAFEAGEVTEAAYHEAREVRKARIRAVLAAGGDVGQGADAPDETDPPA